MKPGRATEPDNEKNQVCGLRARAKGLLADFAPPRKGGGEAAGIRYVAKTGKVWLSQVDTLSSKHTPDARKTRFSLFGFNLTQARAADDELWCVYDPVFDLFLPCEPAA